MRVLGGGGNLLLSLLVKEYAVQIGDVFMDLEQFLGWDLSDEFFCLSIEDPDDHVAGFFVNLEIEPDIEVVHEGLLSKDGCLDVLDRVDARGRLDFVPAPHPGLCHFGLNRIAPDFHDTISKRQSLSPSGDEWIPGELSGLRP